MTLESGDICCGVAELPATPDRSPFPSTPPSFTNILRPSRSRLYLSCFCRSLPSSPPLVQVFSNVSALPGNTAFLGATVWILIIPSKTHTKIWSSLWAINRLRSDRVSALLNELIHPWDNVLMCYLEERSAVKASLARSHFPSLRCDTTVGL